MLLTIRLSNYVVEWRKMFYTFLILYIQATLETTIGNSNPSRSKYIQPTSILEGLRVMLANRLSTTGMEWGKNFQKYNSGT